MQSRIQHHIDSSAMHASPSLLAFHDVSLWLDDQRFSDLEQVDFSLGRGELLFVQLDGERESPLPALAIGERPPQHPECKELRGRITFEGIAWPDRTAHDLLACRGRIGLVLTQGAWVSNLSILDNVLLRALHHTHIPRRQIVTQAQELAYRVGLAEVPPLRMSNVGRSELKRAEWVRAFLGDPTLVILQRPCRDVEQTQWESLAELVRQTLARDGGVLWLASDPLEIALAAGLANQRFAMNGTRMNWIEG